MSDTPSSLHRRDLFLAAASIGVGTVTFQRALAAQVAKEPKTAPDPRPARVTAEMIQQAEWISGITLTEDERKQLATRMTQTLRSYEAARKIRIPYGVPPAIQFEPAPGMAPYVGPRGTVTPTQEGAVKKPTGDDDLAFMPLTSLAGLVRSRQISSLELTKFYLDRLRKYDPALFFVISFTEELAIQQAKKADAEIAAGRYRGPLHGIPWGAKDLIAVPGYRTTWGAGHYQNQTLPEKATVARRLEEAGAVLVAKLTMGTLALGDVWYGGTTKNPWNPKQGSSGSSAGSGSAVAAGCVGFAIGTETLGSIISPSTRCQVTGLRPTFGRISRHGCMALTWTMDKLGPMARSVEDCALIFGAIHGADGLDPTAVNRPYSWPLSRDLRSLRVGYFEGERNPTDEATLKTLKEIGVKLVPIQLPSDFPLEAIRVVLTVEAAAAFDDLTREGVRDGIGFWGQTFRHGQFVSAVEYLRANRLRSMLMQEMAKVMEQVDLYVGGNDLVLTNLTGHPTVCIPAGIRKTATSETQEAVTFTGKLYGETEVLAVARAFQDATGIHLRRPAMDKLLPAKKES